MLLAVAEAGIPAAAAQTRDPRYPIDIPAGPLASGLAALSLATGVSVGFAGDLPNRRTAPLRGRMTVTDALRSLLAGSGLRATPIGPAAFRIERQPAPPRPAPPDDPPAAPSYSAPPLPEADIVVTGQKRPQILNQVPLSLAVITFDDVTPGGVTGGDRDLASSVEGLAFTNLGPGRNRQFIRGIADSPFNGPSQSTVATHLDEARVTFDGPDPDLRLVDIERVEILKGPQGPLYGSGALGGIFHIVTRKPEMDTVSADVRLLGEAVAHGNLGAGGEAVVNVPLVDDRLAMRAVGYGLRAAGWIKNIGRNDDANITRTYGGRLALRWTPSPDWTIDLGADVQYLNVADSQYVTASDDTLSRASAIPEPADNDFKAVTASVLGHVGTLKLLSATSFVDHTVDFRLDASDAAARFGLSGLTVFDDDRRYTIFNQELRVSPAQGDRWLAGASLLIADSHSEASLTADNAAPLRVETLDRHVTEFAVFGEGSVPLSPRIKATGGLRLSRTVAADEAVARAGGVRDSIGTTDLSPSLSLSWTPSPATIVFLRYAEALRPGGLAPGGRTGARRFDSDELGTLDLGIRHGDAGRLTFTANLFYSNWNHIQSDYLLANGLVSTRNAGRGRIFGGEASVDWHLSSTLRLSAGVNVQHGRLVSTEAGLKLEDLRLPVTPDATGRLAITRDVTLGAWHATFGGQANYVGKARLSFDDNLDRVMGHYATFAANAAFRRDRLTLAAKLDNILDIRADSFAFGNPFSILEARQYTPLRPRTLTVSIARSW